MKLALFSTLRARLMALVIITMLPVFGLMLYRTGVERDRALLEAQNNEVQLASASANSLGQVVAGARQLLLALAYTDVVRSANRQAISARLTNLLEHTPAYVNLGLVGGDGAVLASALPLTDPVNRRAMPWFERLQATRAFSVGEFELGGMSGQPTITLAYPLPDQPAGQPVTSVTAALKQAALQTFVAGHRLPPGFILNIVDRRGIMLARNTEVDKWLGKPSAAWPKFKSQPHDRSGFVETTGIDGQIRLYHFEEVPGSEGGLFVGVAVPQDYILMQSRSDYWYKMAWLALSTLVTLVLVRFLAGVSVLRHVRQLTAAARRLAGGDLAGRVPPVSGVLELEQLANNFNDMASALQQQDQSLRSANVVMEQQVRARTAELREARDYLDQLLEHANAPIVVWDTDLRITRFNQAFERLTGLMAAEVVGQNLAVLFPPEQRETTLNFIRSTRQAYWEDVELTVQDRTGALRTLLWNAATLYAADERTVQATIAQGHDITRRKQSANVDEQFRQTLLSLVEDQKAVELALRESSVLNESLLATIPFPMDIVDEQGKILFVSPRMNESLGREAVGKVCWEVYKDDRQQCQNCPLREFLVVGETKSTESSGALSGKTFQIHHTGMIFQGRRAILEVFIDITAQKKAEATLRANEALLEESQQIASLGSYTLEVAKGVWSSSAGLSKVFGIDADYDCSVAGWSALVHPADRALMADYFRDEVLGRKQPFDREYRIIRQNDQAERWVRGLGRLELDAGGNVLKMIGTIQDITESRLAKETLARERMLLRTLVDHLPVAVYLKDSTGRKTLANLEDLRNCGYTSEADVFNKTDFDLYPPEEAAQFYADDQQVLSSGQPLLNRVEKLTRPDGTEHWLLTSKVPLFGADGHCTGLVGFGLDITGRKQLEEDLIRLATAVEQSTETIVITDLEANIVYANPAFEKTSGYLRAEALGRNPRLLKSGEQSADFYRQMWLTLKSGQAWSGHFRNRRKDGTVYEEEATISPVRDAAGQVVNYVAVKRDVTHEAQLEAALRQSQKMEAIGQLAGGVAHDFNNILAALLLQTELLAMEDNLSGETREGLRQIRADAERATSLVRQLLLFSRRQVLQSHDLNLNDIIRNFSQLLQRLIGQHIQVQMNFHPAPLEIHADAGMIEQVLMNLAVNARDAMPQGGQLIIETREHIVSAAEAATNSEVAPGRYACLRVSDTGGGIPPEALPRIFEPFFTTKEVGKGTGLGLATAFGIIKQHHGWIQVDNQPGTGVTFQIYLPMILAPAVGVNELVAPSPAAGTETILWVEDEAAVRKATRQVLERHGYRVLEAASGVEALAVWPEHRGAIALLLTDLMMPGGLGGMELARQMRLDSPRLKVIFTSGYSAEIAGQELQLQCEESFLQKPFTPNHLLEVIRQRLDAKS